MTTEELRAELEGDPLSLGYAAYLHLGDDASVAGLLNARSGPGSGPVHATMSRDPFLLAIIPAVMAIGSLGDAKKDSWDRILGVIKAADVIEVGKVQGLLDLAVADGILSAEYRATIGVRAGSRAEVLFGVDTVVSHDSVGAAR